MFGSKKNKLKSYNNLVDMLVDVEKEYNTHIECGIINGQTYAHLIKDGFKGKDIIGDTVFKEDDVKTLARIAVPSSEYLFHDFYYSYNPDSGILKISKENNAFEKFKGIMKILFSTKTDKNSLNIEIRIFKLFEDEK